MSATEPLFLPGFDTPQPADYVPVGETTIPPVLALPRTFAGLPISTIVLGALVLILALMSVWQTREIMALKSHRIVSVGLTTLLRDFLTTEARNGGSPEAAAMRTKLYLAATQASVRELAEKGNTVVVSEAVVGNSVADVTPAVKADIEAKLKAVQISTAMAAK